MTDPLYENLVPHEAPPPPNPNNVAKDGNLVNAGIPKSSKSTNPAKDKLNTARISETGRSLSASEVQSSGQVKSISDLPVQLLKLFDSSEYPLIADLCAQFEQKTSLKCEQLAYGALFLLSLYLLVGKNAELVCDLVSVSYPLVATVTALHANDPSNSSLWLSFWIMYGLCDILEFWKQNIQYWCPAYWFLKTLFMLYLCAPQTHGALTLKNKFIEPAVTQIEKIFDFYANDHTSK